MNKPIIKIKWEVLDYLLEELALAGLIAMIVLPAYFYLQLPDQIPTHFNFKGNADSYGKKNLIWILPVIGVLLYAMLSVVNRYPHKFNYPVKVDETNAYKQYKNASRLIRILKVIICCCFAYITYAQIQSALENQKGLGSYFVPLFLVLILTNTGYYFYKSSLNNETD